MLIVLLAAMIAAASPSDAGMQREMGKALFKEGRLEEAIERFQAAVKLNPSDSVSWYNLAYASRKAKKFGQAAEAYQKYTALSPDDPDGYFGLAESLRQAGRPADAIASYTTYISREKRPTEQKWVDEAKARVAELQAASASPQPSVPAVQAATDGGQPAADAGAPAGAGQSHDPAPHIQRGDAAFAAKDYRSAVFAYQDAILAAPGSVEALVKAGNAYEKLGHDDEAMAQWTKALQLDPRNTAAQASLAAALERRAGLPAPPPPPAVQDEAASRARYIEAVGLIGEKKYDEAAAALDKALALKPGFAVALVARGSARMGQKRYPEALADYSAAQKADPSLASPLFGMAEAFRGLGQPDKAVPLYRQFAQSPAPDAQASLKDYALQTAQALSGK